MISAETKFLTEIIADNFWKDGRVDLEAVCADEGLDILLDDYKHHFDGMLVWDGREFNIHLNTTKGNTPTSNRGRFTLAHELGHYFIESHREGIRVGSIPLHSSHSGLVHSDLLESQADAFAANLLLPAAKLRNLTAKRPFSLNIIREISEKFGVSLTAAALRFATVGTHEIMIVFSEDGKVKWSVRSHDFPKLANKFRIGGALPPTTVANQFFLNPGLEASQPEQLDFEEWFENRGWDPRRNFYEQCFYSDIYNYAISLLWFK
ncbi:ImmA/IrrE family metallo-endopeptidase [Niabella sp.]|uniref:ImmA/IrrE family metallo-endopeptidase n=1 Tax=Niabella sp. TaxID=1962976 RepID=UPI0026035328|nr:ImmA/IrrE family metallo-endopeptidase [Niabella sp.]